MWFRFRLKRLVSKWKHLNLYFKTLSSANTVDKQTDFKNLKQPVLLLYGFGATRRSLSVLESRLKRDGFNVFSLNLGGFLDLFNTDPIDLLAQKVAQKIERLAKRYSFPRFSIVGFSKGGLIGRYYLHFLGGSKYAHTLITLGTPHKGNPWALLHLIGLFSKGVRQMSPHSKFIQMLNQTKPSKEIYMASLFSPADRYCPPEFCLLPNGSKNTSSHNVSIPHLRHSDFVLKQRAYQEIVKHLRRGISFSKSFDVAKKQPTL